MPVCCPRPSRAAVRFLSTYYRGLGRLCPDFFFLSSNRPRFMTLSGEGLVLMISSSLELRSPVRSIVEMTKSCQYGV